jgi:hypothetical protein
MRGQAAVVKQRSRADNRLRGAGIATFAGRSRQPSTPYARSDYRPPPEKLAVLVSGESPHWSLWLWAAILTMSRGRSDITVHRAGRVKFCESCWGLQGYELHRSDLNPPCYDPDCEGRRRHVRKCVHKPQRRGQQPQGNQPPVGAPRRVRVDRLERAS